MLFLKDYSAGHPARSRHLSFGMGLLLVALTWFLRTPMHDLPLDRDEGAYAVIATRWLAGDILYRDLFDHKPPLLYLVYALARMLPGDPVHAIRVLATLYLIIGGLLLFALGWRLYGRWAALAALALFLTYGSSLRFQGLIFNSEAVLLPPAILGCLLVVRGMQGRRWVLFGLAGVCVGLASAIKPVGASLIAPLCLAPLLVAWSWPRRLLVAALAFGGAMLPLLGFTLLFWRQGALPAAYEALITYNRLYAAESLAREWDLQRLWRIWEPMLTLAVPALAGLFATLAVRDWRTPAHGITALWGLVLLATAFLSLRAYPHYYLVAVPFFSLWAGAGIVALSRWLWHRRQRWLAGAVGIGMLAGMLLPPLYEIWPLRTLSPLQQISTLYAGDGANYFGPAAEVARYVAARVPADQPIFVWAAEPEIYLLADRRPATRFIYDYPVDRLPAARNELLARLRENPPPLIITYYAVRPLGFHPFMDDYGYELRTTIGGYDIFERSE